LTLFMEITASPLFSSDMLQTKKSGARVAPSQPVAVAAASLLCSRARGWLSIAGPAAPWSAKWAALMARYLARGATRVLARRQAAQIDTRGPCA
jgi:hypothetical protein